MFYNKGILNLSGCDEVVYRQIPVNITVEVTT